MRVARCTRNLHTLYGRGAPNFMPRVAFTRASFPALPPSHPALSSPTLWPFIANRRVLWCFFFARIPLFPSSSSAPKKSFSASEPIRDIGRRRKRNALVSCEPRYPRFTVHLSAQESPSDKFQVSRLNERNVLPPLFVGKKKAAHYSDSRNFETRNLPAARLWLTRLWLVYLKGKKYANESCFQAKIEWMIWINAKKISAPIVFTKARFYKSLSLKRNQFAKFLGNY